MVGTSGAAAQRVLDSTANALILPLVQQRQRVRRLGDRTGRSARRSGPAWPGQRRDRARTGSACRCGSGSRSPQTCDGTADADRAEGGALSGWPSARRPAPSTLFAREAGLADDPHRRDRQQRHRLQILQQVVRQLVDGAVEDVRAQLGRCRGVAVGRRARDAADADACRPRRSHSRRRPADRATSFIRSARMRARVSVGPPAEYGTISVIGRDG